MLADRQLGAARAVSVLDVPISGSTAAAEQGTLTLFAGGERKIFDGAEPIFRAVAWQYFYLGPSGSGTTMKLVANDVQTMVLAGSGHWVAEQAPDELLAALTAFLAPYRDAAAAAHADSAQAPGA